MRLLRCQVPLGESGELGGGDGVIPIGEYPENRSARGPGQRSFSLMDSPIIP